LTFVIGVLIGFLAVAAAIRYRERLTGTIAPRGLTDEQIRAIEERGTIDMDEPLDLDHIRDEESRFWEETWDDPEEL
jgi:hypothetical protein